MGGGDQRSHPADARYRPLGGIEPWRKAPEDGGAWDAALSRLTELRLEAPAWSDMVGRGALLAAAHQSGALASLYPAGRAVARSLLSGEASPSAIGAPEVTAHVGAGYAALRLAAGGDTSEAHVRAVHAAACAPQVTHAVRGAGGDHDHVLGHGDYKHHPNHVPDGAGGWRTAAPVDAVRAEMARLADAPTADLHPVARSAFVLHALHHIRPFAAGNGRVARALAGGALLPAGGIPLLVFAADAGAYREALAAADGGHPAALVSFVQQRCTELVALVDDLHAAGGAGEVEGGPLHRWRRRVEAAHRLHALVPPAAQRALDRHRARTDLGWLSPLAATAVVSVATRAGDPTFAAPPVVLRSAFPSGPSLDETLAIKAHPPSGDHAVVLRAEIAELTLEVEPGELLPEVSAPFLSALDAWLERVFTSLAVTVAARAGGDAPA